MFFVRYGHARLWFKLFVAVHIESNRVNVNACWNFENSNIYLITRIKWLENEMIQILQWTRREEIEISTKLVWSKYLGGGVIITVLFSVLFISKWQVEHIRNILVPLAYLLQSWTSRGCFFTVSEQGGFTCEFREHCLILDTCFVSWIVHVTSTSMWDDRQHISVSLSYW